MIAELCLFESGEEKLWDAYVERTPGGLQSQLSGWRRVVASAYGHPSYYLWVRDGTTVRGVLPLIFIQSRLFGRSLVSMPFLDDGGSLADDDVIRDRLLTGALALYERLGADSLDLRYAFPFDRGTSPFGKKVTLRLDLGVDEQRMWTGFDAKLRNQIRKAGKSGLTVRWGGEDLLKDFYSVFSVNMRDLGSPVHGLGFFEAVLKEFPGQSRLILIHLDEKPIGGGLLLSHKETLMMPWASSLRSHFSLCPNYLLYWEALRWGCKNGFKRFDFGRSTPGSGTYDFKKNWGAREEPLYWQLHSRKAEPEPGLQSESPLFRLAGRVWKRIPLGVTRWIGPVLRGQITN